MEKKRLFYELDIKVRRVEADFEYSDPQLIDAKPRHGIRLVLDSTLIDKLAGGAGDMIIKQVLEALRAAYATESYGADPQKMFINHGT